MKFFNSLIHDASDLLRNIQSVSYSYSPEKTWPDFGRNEVVLQRDTAFELNGTGFNLITDDPVENEICVYGDDLGNIYCSRRFARISVISIEDVEDEQKAYDLIRKIEYTKYHCFPKGYMMRTSSQSQKEVVRVSKNAIHNGISFEKVGNLFINAYHNVPYVKGVRILFVTDEKLDYHKFDKLAAKNHSITETLNHVMNNLNFDCSTCNLKPICDEIEGMRELHFKKSRM